MMQLRSLARLSALIAALVSVGVGRAQADNFIVTNKADDGAGSLRQAVALANYYPNNDTIGFASGLTGTITLNSEIVINRNVDIVGPGASQLTVSGNNATRIFNVLNGYVNVSGLTLAGGSHNSDVGAAIKNTNGIMTVTDCTLSGNQATRGGAIYSYNGMTINTCTFTGNIAAFNASDGSGGAIYNEGPMVINNSSFSTNQAPFQIDSATGIGGAIFNSRLGTLTLNGCSFSSNRSSTGGGACYNTGKLTVTNSSFSNCTSPGSGGGIYNDSGGTLSVSNSTFSANTSLPKSSTSGRGAAIFNFGTLTSRYCTYSGNKARQGGAIYNAVSNTSSPGVFLLQNNTFNDNQVQGYNQALTSSCQAQSCAYFVSGQGGALYSDSGTATVTNATFTNNLVTGSRTQNYNTANDQHSGGALFNGTSSSLALLNCTFSGNADNSTNTDATSHIGTLVNLGTISSRNSVFVDGSSLPFFGLSNPTSSGDTSKNFSFSSNSAASLNALANNGGPISTMALSSNSPLIDAGLAEDAPTTDARGAARPQGQGVDVGAYELGTIGSLFSLTGSITSSQGGGGVAKVSVSLFNSRGNRVGLTVSDNSGNWSFTDLPPDTYTVTPSRAGYRFAPPSRTITLTNASQSTTFVGTPPTESLVVTTLADEDDGTSDVTFGTGTSLREAIGYANSSSDQNTISFQNGLTGTINLQGTALTISGPLTIAAPSGPLTINAGGQSAVFVISYSVNISNLTIKGGSNSGIINYGALNLTNCTISNNNSADKGGGLYSTGPDTINNCTFSANTAKAGGALYTINTTTITNSTFAGNSAQSGGAIQGYDYAMLRVNNSTITGNQATQSDGGGIDYTMSGGNNSLYLTNTIVAGNQAVNSPDIAAGSINSDYSLVQNTSGVQLSGTGNLTGVNPLLSSLASNGGPTQTVALLMGSPAINAGDPSFDDAFTPTDQRGTGYPRVSSGRLDIGAYEYQGNIAPTNVSISPNFVISTYGTAKYFTATYSDGDGFADLSNVQMIVGATLATANVLNVSYDAPTNKLYLRNDAGTALLGGFAPGSNNTISNSQGSLNCASTTVGRSGSTLTVNWNLTPSQAFIGTKNLYLYSKDSANATAGWNDLGDWVVKASTNSAPSNTSLAPASSANIVGTARSFGAVYSDADGALDIGSANLLINTTLNTSNALWCYYDSPTNKLYLKNDDSSALLGGFAPGSANTISNSQGSLNCADTVVARSGNNLTIYWNVTPSAAFVGTKNVFLYVKDSVGATAGWNDLGDWLVKSPTNTAPTLVSLAPASSANIVGTARTFGAVYSDADGALDITSVQFIINSTLTQVNGLVPSYDPATDKLFLKNDAGTALIGGFTPGSANVISNSQGSLNCANTVVVRNGNTLTVYWNVTPSASFTGVKNLYQYVRDASNASAGFTDMGDWLVKTSANIAPTVVSVTPSASSSTVGAAKSLSAVYSDADGALDLTSVQFIVNGTLTQTNGLVATYDPTTNKLFLKNDAGTTLLGGFEPGSANVISNSQGSLNCAATTVTRSGNTLTVNWNFTPTASFTGTKNLYLFDKDTAGASAGFTDKGDWTITAEAAPMMAPTSQAPSAGSS